MGQNLRMGQNEENGAKVENVKHFAKTRMCKKPIVFLAQMGQKLRICKMPHFLEMGSVGEKVPHYWIPKGHQILAILSQNIWGGVGELDP